MPWLPNVFRGSRIRRAFGRAGKQVILGLPGRNRLSLSLGSLRIPPQGPLLSYHHTASLHGSLEARRPLSIFSSFLAAYGGNRARSVSICPLCCEPAHLLRSFAGWPALSAALRHLVWLDASHPPHPRANCLVDLGVIEQDELAAGSNYGGPSGGPTNGMRAPLCPCSESRNSPTITACGGLASSFHLPPSLLLLVFLSSLMSHPSWPRRRLAESPAGPS